MNISKSIGIEVVLQNDMNLDVNRYLYLISKENKISVIRRIVQEYEKYPSHLISIYLVTKQDIGSVTLADLAICLSKQD